METALPADFAEDTPTLGDATLACFAQLGALRLNTSRAFVSLVDRNKQYVLAEASQSNSSKGRHVDAVGQDLWLGCTTRPASQALCSWTIGTWNLANFSAVEKRTRGAEPVGAAFVVNDLSKDKRYSSLPFVQGPPFVRFYAGAPLISSESNWALGTYCVIDDKPRDAFDTASIEFLVDMANSCMTHLTLKRAQLSVPLPLHISSKRAHACCGRYRKLEQVG